MSNEQHKKVFMMTPKQLHFRMPAEWERHACTFMEWPENPNTWFKNVSAAQKAYAEVAKAIAAFEPVIMIASAREAGSASDLCGPAVRILIMEHDDSWMRDNGPTFIIGPQNQLAGINWKFNAWGEKTKSWKMDDLVAPRLLERLKITCFNAPIILEGGSIHVDGEGTLLVTEECLLNKNRNPHLNKAELETILEDYLNIHKVIWLKRGLYGDGTDGHVDNVACFARPGTIIIQTCGDPADPNYEISMENLRILESKTDAQGRHFEIISIEQPPATYFQGNRLPMSYINFYLANGGLVFPKFGGTAVKTDDLAEAALRKAFPDRKIIGIDGTTIIKGGGNIHCITQQMPAGIADLTELAV